MITVDNRVETILERLRPAIHGLQLQEITMDGVVKVLLADACGCCSMSLPTVKAAVERLILEAVPEANRVEVEEA